jgi:hypothetical protein
LKGQRCGNEFLKQIGHYNATEVAQISVDRLKLLNIVPLALDEPFDDPTAASQTQECDADSLPLAPMRRERLRSESREKICSTDSTARNIKYS